MEKELILKIANYFILSIEINEKNKEMYALASQQKYQEAADVRDIKRDLESQLPKIEEMKELRDQLIKQSK